MTLTRFALAAFLSVAAATASAATFDLSTGSFAETAGKTDRSEFTDVYNFSWGSGAGTVAGSLTENRTAGSVDIDWGDVAAITIYGGLDASGPSLYVYGGPYDPALTLTFGDIAVPSQFSVAIRGRAIGSGGDAVPQVFGSYRLDLVAQPVPEPGSVALMLAGLGVLGFAASRRRAAAR